MIIDTDWEIGLEIQEQNLNIKMNTLTRANQAGRSNLPVKVTRIPFLRKSVLQVSFQKVSENTFINSQSTPEASGWEDQWCLVQQHSLWLLQKQCNDLKLPCCNRIHHWAMRTLCKKTEIFDTFWHWKMHDLRWFCTWLHLRYICSKRFWSITGLIHGWQGTNLGCPSFQSRPTGQTQRLARPNPQARWTWSW